MSLKSFDKFCERLILAEPGSQKEIFDERQNVMRSRLAIEALFIYVGLTFLNSMVMEMFYQWAESQMAVTLLFAVICLLWWEIRCALKGCMLAVSGRYAQKYSAIMAVFVGALNGLRYVFDIGKSAYYGVRSAVVRELGAVDGILRRGSISVLGMRERSTRFAVRHTRHGDLIVADRLSFRRQHFYSDRDTLRQRAKRRFRQFLYKKRHGVGLLYDSA